MPKRLVCPAKGKVAWEEYAERSPGRGEVRVEFHHGVEKHGTMMAFFKGYGNERGRWDEERNIFIPGGELWGYPVPLGNMQVGRVVECGPETKRLKVGDEIYLHCEFRPSNVIRETGCRILPEGSSWKAAMLTDPAEFAIGALRDGHVRLGDCVAVFGLGAIGLVTVQLAKKSGAMRVVAVDPLPNRREAGQRCGADRVIDPTGEDVGLILREDTGGRGPDVVIDFSGSPHALQAAIRGVAYAGTVVCGAFPPPYGAGLDFGGEAHMNLPRIVFSRACSEPQREHPRWTYERIQQTAVELAESGALDAEPILTPTIRFDDLLEEYPKIASDPGSNIKLTVQYD